MGKTYNTKFYQFLSYIGFLWIFGLFTYKKDDKTLKVHVGQGIIIFFIEIIVLIINNLIIANLLTTKTGTFEFHYTSVSPLGICLMIILYALPILLSVIGILKVIKEKDPKIPIISSLAFYK